MARIKIQGGNPLYVLEDITALVVNYRTLDLTCECLESFRRHYPQVHMLLIDNGSVHADPNDRSMGHLQNLAAEEDQITLIENPTNRFHGPALNQGLRAIHTPLALTLDSDVVVERGGFLEELLPLFNDPGLYAAGALVPMDPFGYEAERPGRFTFEYVRPCCMLIDRGKYLNLRPFIHHGSPGIHNFRHAHKVGYHLHDFPIYDYILHKGRGTCARYGYGLGRRHTFEHLLRNTLRVLSGKTWQA
jgi:hypothetical protein